MIPATTFGGKQVALFGLGGSGIATAHALVQGGASVLAWDDNPESVANAAAAGIPVGDLRQAEWRRFASFVLSPGVPLTHPEPHWTVQKARASGVEIIGDIEIFARERAVHAARAPFIAITGIGFSLIATLFGGASGALGSELGLPVGVGIFGIVVFPIIGYLIIVVSRFIAEQIRALAAIANNTKK